MSQTRNVESSNPFLLLSSDIRSHFYHHYLNLGDWQAMSKVDTALAEFGQSSGLWLEGLHREKLQLLSSITLQAKTLTILLSVPHTSKDPFEAFKLVETLDIKARIQDYETNPSIEKYELISNDLKSLTETMNIDFEAEATRIYESILTVHRTADVEITHHRLHPLTDLFKCCKDAFMKLTDIHDELSDLPEDHPKYSEHQASLQRLVETEDFNRRLFVGIFFIFLLNACAAKGAYLTFITLVKNIQLDEMEIIRVNQSKAHFKGLLLELIIQDQNTSNHAPHQGLIEYLLEQMPELFKFDQSVECPARKIDEKRFFNPLHIVLERMLTFECSSCKNPSAYLKLLHDLALKLIEDGADIRAVARAELAPDDSSDSSRFFKDTTWKKFSAFDLLNDWLGANPENTESAFLNERYQAARRLLAAACRDKNEARPEDRATALQYSGRI